MERNREEIRKRLEEMLKGNEEIVWAKDPVDDDDYKVLEGKWVINEVELDEFAKKTRSANKQGEYTDSGGKMKKIISIGVILLIVLALYITLVIIKYKEQERKKEEVGMVWESYMEAMQRDVDSGSIDTGGVK